MFGQHFTTNANS